MALSLGFPASKSPGGRYPPPLFRGARTFLAVLANPAAARPPGGWGCRGWEDVAQGHDTALAAIAARLRASKIQRNVGPTLGAFIMLLFAITLLAQAAVQAEATAADFRLENVKSDAPPQVKTPEPNKPPQTTSWMTRNGYPTRALREHREGTVHFTAHISSTGQVTTCEITGSSGSPDLDEATCQQLKLRAHFTPATDENGEPIEGVYSQTFRWVIPQD